MKIKKMILRVVVASAFFGVLPSGYAGSHDLPEGPYRSSCVRCQMSLGVLDCDCPTTDNRMVHCEVRITEGCENVWNQNGKLVCG